MKISYSRRNGKGKGEGEAAEDASVAEDEGAVTMNEAEVAQVAEHEGHGSTNEGNLTQNEANVTQNVKGKGKGESEVDVGRPLEEASMEQIAEFVSVLEELVAEAACVADDEGAVTPDAEVSEDAEHEGNGPKNDGSVKRMR